MERYVVKTMKKIEKSKNDKKKLAKIASGIKKKLLVLHKDFKKIESKGLKHKKMCIEIEKKVMKIKMNHGKMKIVYKKTTSKSEKKNLKKRIQKLEKFLKEYMKKHHSHSKKLKAYMEKHQKLGNLMKKLIMLYKKSA